MHLTFIQETDFDLPERWKQNDDGSISWWHENTNGIIREGFTRDHQVQTGTETVVVGQEPIVDEDGEPVLDEEGNPTYTDVTEEQPIFETQTVDVWATLQAKIANGEITVEQKTQEEIDAEAAEAAKAAKAQAIANLTVEVDGMTFQANELSRQRMADAILASEHLGVTEHTWRLADNTQATVTITQLKQAHADAIQAFGALILE